MNRFFKRGRKYEFLESHLNSTKKNPYKDGPRSFFEKRKQSEDAISKEFTRIKGQFSNYRGHFSVEDGKNGEYSELEKKAEGARINAINDKFALLKTLKEYDGAVKRLREFVNGVIDNDKNNPFASTSDETITSNNQVSGVCWESSSTFVNKSMIEVIYNDG